MSQFSQISVYYIKQKHIYKWKINPISLDITANISNLHLDFYDTALYLNTSHSLDDKS